MDTGLDRKTGINILPVGFIYFGLFLLAVWIDGHRRLFRFPKPDENFFAIASLDVLIGLTVGLAVVGLTTLSVKVVLRFRELTKYFHNILGPLNGWEIFFLASFSAVGEEFFFRGFLQGELGLTAASIIFGLLHVGPNRKFMPWTIFAILIGFGLGALYSWRGDLLLPVTTHFTINFANLWILKKWGHELLG